MRILIGYGDAPGTTGQYFEEALSAQHDVHFAGRGSAARRGYAPDLDLGALVARLQRQGWAPDLFLYLDSGNNPFAPWGLPRLSIPTAAYFMDAYPPGIAQRTPYLETLAPHFDHLFVAHRTALPHWRALRGAAPTAWLPPCCDPAVHGNQHLDRIYDVGFVGQVNAGYPDRVRLLAALERKYKLNDYRERHYRHEMARIYSQSKIVVNISHSNAIIPMRFFEAPAAGAMLLTEASATNGQSELLVEGEQYATFAGVEDALEKVDYYLAHAEERERIAAAGEAAILAHHTYAQRTAQLLDSVQVHAAHGCAPARVWSEAAVHRAYLHAWSQLRLMDCVMDCQGAPLSARLYYAGLALMRRIKHRE